MQPKMNQRIKIQLVAKKNKQYLHKALYYHVKINTPYQRDPSMNQGWAILVKILVDQILLGWNGMVGKFIPVPRNKQVFSFRQS